MKPFHLPEEPAVQTEGWLSRERSLAIVLIVASSIVGYLCYCLMKPFLPSLAWTLALAVIAHPLHRRIHGWIKNPNLAAGFAVFIVAILVVAPAVFVTRKLATEATNAGIKLQTEFSSGNWRKLFLANPRLKPLEAWTEKAFGLEPAEEPGDDANDDPALADETNATATNADAADNADSENRTFTTRSRSSDGESSATDTNTSEDPASPAVPVERAAEMLTRGIGSLVTGTGWFLMQLLITFMSLFYFFRDRRSVLKVLRSLLPLTNVETDDVFRRVNDTIHATLYGSVAVAFVQGSMGGLIFWWLGLPSPLLWGAIMSLLAVVPLLGTFVIWAPVALVLALQGDWTRAGILLAWGALAIGMIDNFLYPFLVGKRLRLHTLLIFFAIVGGITVFGTSGVILGPLLLASADALLDIWRRRTAYGGTIEDGVEEPSMISPTTAR
jgi:predicted PurR-regulated permease PerM